MSFPQRLKHERLVKGWTIEQLSQASGVTAQRIAMLERNLVESVSEGLKAALEKALEISFDAPPSGAADTVQEVASPRPVAVLAPAAPAAPVPLALHLSTSLRQQLEATAHAHGRSLHGEILARLEASLAAPSTAVVVAAPAPAAEQEGRAVIQLSDADLAHITEQVALRLQARG